MKSPPLPAGLYFPAVLLTLGMGREEGVDLLGWLKEEGLDGMRPLGIFLENCRSLSAREIWAIWINRVKLHVGSDEVVRGGGAAWPRQKELRRAADRCTKAPSRRHIPSLPRLSRHGRRCHGFSSSPSICLLGAAASEGTGSSVGFGSMPRTRHVRAGRGSLVTRRVGR